MPLEYSVTLVNHLEIPLTRLSADLVHGRWVGLPPETVQPGAIVQLFWACGTPGLFGPGSEGTVSYDWGTTQPIQVHFANPVVGDSHSEIEPASSRIRVTHSQDHARIELLRPLEAPPVSLNGLAAAAPAAGSWGFGRLDVFALNTNGGLVHLFYDGRWHNQELLHAPPLTAIAAAASDRVGRLDVFGIDTQGNLVHLWYDGAWAGPETLGNGFDPQAPAAMAPESGRLMIFASRMGQLWRLDYDERSGWSSWAPSDISGESAPAITTWRLDGRVDMFTTTTGMGAGSLAHRWGQQGTISGYETFEAGIVAAPAASAWEGQQRLDVIARGITSPGATHHKWYGPNGWSGWEDIGGPPADGLALASWGAGRLDAFAVSGGRLFHSWYDSSTDKVGWQPWTTLPDGQAWP